MLNNPAAEKALCACVLTNENSFDAVADQVQTAHFFVPQCATLWDKFSSLRSNGKPIDKALVGMPDLVAQCLKTPYALANLATYARTVTELARVRRVVACAQGLVSQSANMDQEKVPAYIEQCVGDLIEASTGEQVVSLVPIKEAAKEALQWLDKMRKEGVKPGMETGFGACDIYTGGKHRSELTYLSARPGIGKTSYALQEAIGIATAGHPVLFVSLEMSKKELMGRALASVSGIDVTKIRLGAINVDERDKLAKAAEKLGQLPLFIDDNSSLTLLGLRAKVRRSKVAKVYIDYLQLMQGDSNQPREREIGMLSRGLKLLAKDLNVSVTALCQLNRKVEERGEWAAPKMSDLRESGNLEQDADNLVFLYQRGEKDMGIVPVTWLLAKQRNGPQGSVDLDFEEKFTRFR